jgi:dipeptidase D
MFMGKTEKLQPAEIWKYFEKICQIPRPSFREQEMIDFLVNFGKQHQLDTTVDKAGNVLIKKTASKGYEKRKSICLQSHLDMVTEKDSSSNHDFDTDPIIPVIDGGWVKASGTTLGADNGIGIAAQLAVLADKTLEHGPMECLFTVEEEVGLKGAGKLKPGFIESTILINLDSEDEGELFIGCAGGIDTVAVLTFKNKIAAPGSKAFKVALGGLIGGHSGDDINKRRGNSIKILTRLIWGLSKKMRINLSLIEGGNLRNAIPREAYAIFTVSSENEQKLKEEFKKITKSIKEEFGETEPGLSISLDHSQLPGLTLKRRSQEKLLNLLQGCPNGVISMSRSMTGLVETSTNLASIKFTGNNEITISTSQRSSFDTGKTDISNTVRSIFELAKAKVSQSDGYPGWNPDTGSEILNITKNAYVKLFQTEPKIKAIHAGLECGMFKKIYPHLDMISFGPTIRDVHSPGEKIEIESVKKFWDLLILTLKEIP